jgi:hypothetical protein
MFPKFPKTTRTCAWEICPETFGITQEISGFPRAIYRRSNDISG